MIRLYYLKQSILWLSQFSIFADFVFVSATLNSAFPAQDPSSTVDLTPLLPFGNPTHHSTPDHRMECNEGSNSSVDVYGIRHSFDKSIHASNSDGPRTETTVSFLASASRKSLLHDTNPQSKDDIEQPFLHATGHSEKNDRRVGPSGSSGSTPQMGKTCLSPFSSFLNRTPQAITPRAISPIAQTSTATEAGQLTSSSNYVTSLDLLALEQRMRTMVSELTTTISSRLIEQFAMPVSQAPGTSTGTETSVTNMESSLMVSPASTTGGQIIPPAGHSRKGRRQTRVREKSTVRINPGDQHSVSRGRDQECS